MRERGQKDMPSKSKRPCSYPRCLELTTEQYCSKHKSNVQRSVDKQRGTANQRGYGSRWQKARLSFLKRNPLCRHCSEVDKLTPANIVDHIKPHKGDADLFWDSSNWQPLCKKCHDIKTATEDGGFGR